MDPRYFEVEKTGSKLFLARKTVLQLFVERKSGSLLFGAPKRYFKTLWSKENEDDFYYKSETLVRNYLEQKKWNPTIWKLKKLVHSYF